MVTSVNGVNAPQDIDAQKSKKSSPIGATISGAAIGAGGGAIIGYFCPSVDIFTKAINKIEGFEKATKEQVKEIFPGVKSFARLPKILQGFADFWNKTFGLIFGGTLGSEDIKKLNEALKETKLKTAGKFALIGAGACAVIGLTKSLIFGKKNEKTT